MEVKIEEEKRKWKNAKENARGNDEEKIQKKNATQMQREECKTKQWGCKISQERKRKGVQDEKRKRKRQKKKEWKRKRQKQKEQKKKWKK